MERILIKVMNVGKALKQSSSLVEHQRIPAGKTHRDVINLGKSLGSGHV